MMKRRALVYGLCALALLPTFVMAGDHLGLGVTGAYDVRAARVTRAAILRSIDLPATLACEGERTLYAQQPGVVSAGPAAAGAAVRQGEVLVQFDDQVQKTSLRAALLSSARAQSALSRLDEAAASLDAPALSALLQLLPASSAALSADAALLSWSMTRVCAPMPSRVLAVHVRTGQAVMAGAALATLGGDANRARVRLSDADVSRVLVGQQVLVQREGVQIAKGRITAIAPGERSADGQIASLLGGAPTSSFAVAEVQLDRTLPLPTGAALTCSIILAQVDAVCVPLEAIGQDDTVLVAVGTDAPRAVRVRVRCGLTDGAVVQLLEGPPEGSVVVLGGAVAEGARLRGLQVLP